MRTDIDLSSLPPERAAAVDEWLGSPLMHPAVGDEPAQPVSCTVCDEPLRPIDPRVRDGNADEKELLLVHLSCGDTDLGACLKCGSPVTPRQARERRGDGLQHKKCP